MPVTTVNASFYHLREQRGMRGGKEGLARRPPTGPRLREKQRWSTPPRPAVPPGVRTILVLIVDFLDKTVADTYGVPDPLSFVAGVMYDNPKNAAIRP